MPELVEQTRIAAPLDVVWPLLSDPAAVASCIPGATLAPEQGDGVWRGAVKVRFGPTTATFRGEATLGFDHEAHRCSIEGRGIDQRGASRALSSGTVAARADGADTLLDVEGRFTVTGPLETFANAGGVHVARALLGEFSANMARLVAERGQAALPAMAEAAAPEPPSAAPVAPVAAARIAPVAPAPVAAPPASTPTPAPAPTPPPAPPRTPSLAPARELSAFRLAWLAFRSWLRSLLGKGTP
ncbi:SRPBCC family protein [Roseicella sp. DB1501]|uniref:SRPBCC family protein n=1 Tax=Roseicella sp. DB1501 TaxID=2730925 RepID=UPI00149251F6|nr:SRPBCC family protein [Roseicella sp. DB1501]NOG69580.1 SRPBCC family protein [Roseicella sp. DB1501]